MDTTLSAPTNLRSKKELIILVVLGIGLIAAIALVGMNQFLGSKADTSYVEIKTSKNEALPQKNNMPVSTDANLKLELKPPVNP